MNYTDRESGIIHVLLERLAKEQLPRLLEIKTHVDQGECLRDLDIEFLKQTFRDASDNAHHVINFPEYGDIVNNVVRLYHDITSRALENEKTRDT